MAIFIQIPEYGHRINIEHIKGYKQLTVHSAESGNKEPYTRFMINDAVLDLKITVEEVDYLIQKAQAKHWEYQRGILYSRYEDNEG